MAGRPRASVSVIVHATEDEGAILGALEGVLGAGRGAFSRGRASGHYGNPITVLRAELAGEEAAAVAGRARAAAGGGPRLTLDKQALVSGRLEPGPGVVVRLAAPGGWIK